jgi:ERCC4-type nuclease
LNYIQRTGVHALSQELEFGDACFEGNGPDGKIAIGIERKKIGDMLNCIDDARYAGHQRPGMLAMYNKSVLMLEGVWKPEPVTGYLMECVAQLTWRPYKYRSQVVRYNKLFRYLISIQLSGVIVITTRDVEQTAYNIVELYHYFGKPWDGHTSLLEIQKLNIPEMRGKPSLVRRWASDLDGIGVKHSMEAEKVFKTPYDLAKSDESDWLRIQGIGVGTAQNIVKQIHGHE